MRSMCHLSFFFDVIDIPDVVTTSLYLPTVNVMLQLSMFALVIVEPIDVTASCNNKTRLEKLSNVS